MRNSKWYVKVCSSAGDIALGIQAKQQKTTLARKEQVKHSWFLVDANEKILGRLAGEIAMILMGKHRPDYTAHVDTGDFVIVTNCEKIRLTGNKAQTMEYDHYTYHTGGRKVITYAAMMKKKPEMIIRQAVRRMLPKSKLGRGMLNKLKVYRGSEHPHTAQKPKPLELN